MLTNKSSLVDGVLIVGTSETSLIARGSLILTTVQTTTAKRHANGAIDVALSMMQSIVKSIRILLDNITRLIDERLVNGVFSVVISSKRDIVSGSAILLLNTGRRATVSIIEETTRLQSRIIRH